MRTSGDQYEAVISRVENVLDGKGVTVSEVKDFGASETTVNNNLGINSSLGTNENGVATEIFSIIDEETVRHSSNGDFTYNPKTGQVSRMKGGGHGQSNIDFLRANGMEYNILKEYDNGVRIGNVPKHKTPSKRVETGQAWFPESWSDEKIAEAGLFVSNLSLH